MFCIFDKDVFVDFWGNSIGDEFVENTIKNLKLNKNEVDLVYYIDLNQVPEFYNFSEIKELQILKEVKSLDENNKEVISYEIDKTIPADIFYSKGIMVKPC